jgi:[acyl-carrier-protein] S-malonyltransferase
MKRTAILLPGQGAQSVGMGKALAEASRACRTVFDRTNEILGRDLARVCFEGPPDELTRSLNAQPGIFAVSMAAYRLLLEKSPTLHVDFAAGLSSGEWTALHLAGVLSFEDTVRVLDARGRFMQEACEAAPGAMVSVIGLDPETLSRICETAGVCMANMNSREQTVLSGPADAVAEASRLASEAGARRTIPLQVAGAFHSPLMQPAADRMRDFLADIALSTPSFPVIANVTGRPHGGPEAIRAAMVGQIVGPVRWYQGIEYLQAGGVTAYVECGPGKVLSGLVKRIDKGATLYNIHDPTNLESVVGNL